MTHPALRYQCIRGGNEQLFELGKQKLERHPISGSRQSVQSYRACFDLPLL